MKRQLAQRCVRPIFSFPFAHLSQKQLPEPVQTGRLQHPADNSQQALKLHKHSTSGVTAVTGSEQPRPRKYHSLGLPFDTDVVSYNTHDPHMTRGPSAAMQENCEFLVSVSNVTI